MTRLCALYGVTRAGYYAWRTRGESARRQQDRTLLQEIHGVFDASGGTYGSPRVQQALAAHGRRVSRRRVARLMRCGGLRARAADLYPSRPRHQRFYSQHPNRLRTTAVTAPDQVWVGDVTYLAVAGRWWYLAVVMDYDSRRILAWRLARARDTRLTRAVFAAATRRRRPALGLIFHSDRGSEYGGTAFRDMLASADVRQSMTRGAAPCENARMESCFHTLKTDVIHGRRFLTADALRTELRHYLRFYNHERLHSSLGYRPPVDYEERAA